MSSVPATLNLCSIIGFSGRVRHALKAHPDRHHVIYPLGFEIIIENIDTRKQEFLAGHDNNVTCIDVSRCGKFIASGQVTYIGFKAHAVVWDYELKSVICTFTQHLGSIMDVAFTYNAKYLITLGGIDDAKVIVWNITSMEAVCCLYSQCKKARQTFCLATFNLTESYFITAGNDNLRIWNFVPERRKIMPTDLTAKKITRCITCVLIDPKDKYFYCGTSTGDVLSFSVELLKLRCIGPLKKLLGCGIICMAMNACGQLLVGSGDGTIALLNTDLRRIKNKAYRVEGGVTSISLRGGGSQFYIGTRLGNKYSMFDNQCQNLECKLFSTAHHDSINGLAFPCASSELLVTGSTQDIRVGLARTREERLRITVPNMICNCVHVMRDGKSIISGWSDCKIRSFYPESGYLMYSVTSAYGSMVTAITGFSSCQKFISGSDLGHLVIWNVPECRRTKDVNYLTKHEMLMYCHGRISAIKITKDDRQFVASSHDGSCVIVDLCTFRQMFVLRADTSFMCVCYHPCEHQVITCGSDRKISFWEVFDGTLIREAEGAMEGTISSLAISADGCYFVTGGEDRLVKFWHYNDCVMTHYGTGHSSGITGVAFSPDESYITSVGSDGAIFIWEFPHSTGNEVPVQPCPDPCAKCE